MLGLGGVTLNRMPASKWFTLMPVLPTDAPIASAITLALSSSARVPTLPMCPPSTHTSILSVRRQPNSTATKPADLLPSVGPPETEIDAFVVREPDWAAGACARAGETSRHRIATSDSVAGRTHRFIETPRNIHRGKAGTYRKSR